MLVEFRKQFEQFEIIKMNLCIYVKLLQINIMILLFFVQIPNAYELKVTQGETIEACKMEKGTIKNMKKLVCLSKRRIFFFIILIILFHCIQCCLCMG